MEKLRKLIGWGVLLGCVMLICLAFPVQAIAADDDAGLIIQQVTEPDGSQPGKYGATIDVYEKVYSSDSYTYEKVASKSISYSNGPVVFSNSIVTSGKEYLAYVHGYVDLGMNRQYYSYLRNFTAPANLEEVNASEAVMVDAQVNPPYSGDYVWGYSGNVYAIKIDPISGREINELPIHVSQMGSNGVMLYSPYLDKGKYKFVLAGDQVFLESDTLNLVENYTTFHFDAAKSCHLTVSADRLGPDPFGVQGTEKVVRMDMQVGGKSLSSYPLGILHESEFMYLTPGIRTYSAQYVDTENYTLIFKQEQGIQFSAGNKNLSVGKDLKAQGSVTSSSLKPGDTVSGKFYVMDSNNARISSVYQRVGDWSGWTDKYVNREFVLKDANGKSVATQTEQVGAALLSPDFTFKIPASLENGNYSLEASLNCGAAGIIKKVFPLTVKGGEKNLRFSVTNTGDKTVTVSYSLKKLQPGLDPAYTVLTDGSVSGEICNIDTSDVSGQALFTALVSVEGSPSALFSRVITANSGGEYTFDYGSAKITQVNCYEDVNNTSPLTDSYISWQPFLDGKQVADGQYIGWTSENTLNCIIDAQGISYRLAVTSYNKTDKQFCLSSPLLTESQEFVNINTQDSFSLVLKPDYSSEYQFSYMFLDMPRSEVASAKVIDTDYYGASCSPETTFIVSAGKYSPRFSYYTAKGDDNWRLSFNAPAVQYQAGQTYTLKSGQEFKINDYLIDKNSAIPGDKVTASYEVFDQYDNRLMKASYQDANFSVYEKKPILSLKKDGETLAQATGNFNNAKMTLPSKIGNGTYTLELSLSAGYLDPVAASTSIVIAAGIVPTIKTQPTDKTVTVGGNASLSVVVNGTGKLTYQWYSNTSDNNTSGTAIIGATKATYAAPTTTAGTRFYYCVVTNTKNSMSASTTSDTATVVVQALTNAAAPTINTQPVGANVKIGGTLSLSIASTVEKGTLTYQWYSNTKNSITGGKKISKATSSTYTIPTAKAAAMYYYCIVTNTDNSATGTKTAAKTSDIVLVNVKAVTNAVAPKITTQPTAVTVNAGETATLKIVAAGSTTGALSYKWYSSTKNSTSGGTIIDGAASSTCSIVTAKAGTMYYYCMVTNTDITVDGNQTATTTSKAAKVMVKALTNATAPKISTQPKDTIVLQGKTASLGIKATGSGKLSYQWYSNTTSSTSDGTIINGATGKSYSIETKTVGTTYYYCIVTNTDSKMTGTKTAATTSNIAKVVVNEVRNAEAPTISTQPMDVSVNLKERANITIVADVDNGKLTYQWYSNTKDSTIGGKKLSGVTRATYSASTSKVGTTYYYCIVTNTDKTATGTKTATTTSNVIQVIVNKL